MLSKLSIIPKSTNEIQQCRKHFNTIKSSWSQHTEYSNEMQYSRLCMFIKYCDEFLHKCVPICRHESILSAVQYVLFTIHALVLPTKLLHCLNTNPILLLLAIKLFSSLNAIVCHDKKKSAVQWNYWPVQLCHTSRCEMYLHKFNADDGCSR